jgi:predicted RNA-binding protein associated with RNAse of E/G family
MVRRKYLGRVPKKYVKSSAARVIRVDEEDMCGYASLTRIHEVHMPLIATFSADGGKTTETVTIYDKDYSELNYLPDGENWQLSVLYDENDITVEWYFDITRENALDEEGRPYCDDLYLDAALMPDGRVIILDEDELQAALDSGEITREDFDLAYATMARIREAGIVEAGYMRRFCERMRALFDE